MVDLDVRFLPNGAANTLDCTATSVTTIKLQFFDEALQGLLRAEVARPCETNQHFPFSIAIGPYLLRIQGLNAQQSSCYQADFPLSLPGGQSVRFTAIVKPAPGGVDAGCTYP
jgi:hypothetical protein